MKRLFVIGWASLLLVPLAHAQSSFINNQIITVPPDTAPQGWVDYYQNNNLISFTPVEQFNFFDVNTLSNKGVFLFTLGARVDTTPSSGGSNHWMTTFGNATGATMAAGSNTFTTGAPAALGSPPLPIPVLDIFATNVVSPGVLDGGINSRVSVTGGSLNLNRGTVHIEGPAPDAIGTGFPVGLFDELWGSGAQPAGLTATSIHAGNFTGLPTTTTFPFVGPYGLTGTASFGFGPPEIFVNRTIVRATNVYYDIVFVNDGADFFNNVQVAFQPGSTFATALIAWVSNHTNSFGQPVNNGIYLTDSLGVLGTNILKAYPGASFTPGGQPLSIPTNYNITTAPPTGLYGPANFTYNTNILTIGSAFSTNTPFSADILFSFTELSAAPFTFAPDPANPDQSGSNVPGRIELNASQVLDLNHARINGPNVLALNSTNHWAGSSNAQIISFDTFLNLGSTNGQLAITNTVVPFLARLNGPIDAWSALWTNQFDSNFVTTNMMGGSNVLTTNSISYFNNFHVMIVESTLSNTSPAFVERAALQSTNVVISDILNVASNITCVAQNLTLTSNNPAGPNQVGEINLLSPVGVFGLRTLFGSAIALPAAQQSILWSPSFPSLQNLTNFGIIAVSNSTFFSHRANSFFPSPGDSPYSSFVNHGQIVSAGGNFIWSDYAEVTGLGAAPDNGVITSQTGDLTITATNAVLLGNCLLSATNIGDMAITAGSLTATNSRLRASGLMTLTVTSNLTDANTLSNTWEFGEGFFLPVKPATGDLLGTILQLDTLPNAEIDILWAGEDRGSSLAGYSNNVALGHLILKGGDANSAFHFIGAGPGASNAMYVDLLELQSGATDGDALDLDPNFTIYFNRATNSTTHKDLTLTLDGSTSSGGGALHQVAFSGGLFNVVSQLVSGNLALNITLANQPANTALISWPAVPNATNSLYSSTSFNGTNWTLVTNIVQGATTTTLTVPVSTAGGGSKYYQLRASPAH